MQPVERPNEVNYSAVTRVGKDVYSKVGFNLFEEMCRETQNRDPAFFELQIANQEWIKEAEMEVIENQIEAFWKLYKNAIKKKSPQSAWKPTFATLEALTLYLQSKEGWFDMKESKRAEEAFKAFGNAWVSTAENLSKLGTFNQNTFPSVRTMITIAVDIGNTINEKNMDKNKMKLSDWPEKLLCVWTGNEFPGDKKVVAEMEGAEKKKKAKGKPVAAEEKKVVRSKRQMREAAVLSPWDFKTSFVSLKDGRKHVGGTAHDLSSLGPEERERAIAGTAAA